MRRQSIGRFLIAASIAALLLIADYFINNLSYPIFDTSSKLMFLSYLEDHDKGEGNEDDMVAVNVAYDKSLAETHDIFSEVIGYSSVTDREKLIQFLEIATKADYRYIFIDVNFPNSMKHPFDSLFFALVEKMPRTIVSTHREDDTFVCNPALPKDKRAYADYRHVRGNSFSKYEFLQDGNESVALRMYHDLYGKTIGDKKFYYTDNGSLCYNTQFINIPKRILSPENEFGEVRFTYLGSQFLAKNTEEEVINRLSGKIVIIGDIENDIHEALIGSVPGPLLSYYAFKSLEAGEHKVNWWLQIFMFVLYTVYGYWIILTTSSSENRLKKVLKNSIKIGFVAFFILTDILFNAIDVVIYLIASTSYSCIVPSAVFTVLSKRRRITYYLKIIKRKFSLMNKNIKPLHISQQ